MSIHLTFTHIKQSEAVEEHITDIMAELLKITDNKFPFHINLTKENEEHSVTINCNYKNKPLVSKANHENLYKAIAKSVDTMKIQVIKKTDKLKHV
ncbi:MAG: HPF/RaiA family ribosome-associated protein [SAR324 cluster bacterium]|nr:HPF/RaiA family ribosome-associated protein [SAR324 cluster bacterium]